MKMFQKKGILQKTIIGILIVLSINFIIPTYSQANIGGVLISPIVDLVCSLGDIVINLLQRCMTGDFGSTGANWSLSMFLIESSQYQGYGQGNEGDVLESNKVDPNTEFDKGWLGLKDEYFVPAATYSPEQIFTNNVAGLDINFINPNKYEKSDGTEVESSAAILQETIAGWYVALRNLAIVGLLSVLVYVGIRIILSSTAADKAKYKQMFTDWLIALCLLFFLHYIMSFIITLTESICQAIGQDGVNSVTILDENKGTFTTNLLGLARFKTQYADMGQKVTYLIFYLALVIYTVMFTWTYLKRLLMMAFLTLIAPLVALTYPIDKISDGQAQAFNTWLKEYIFNALLQPFHLIIYIVFVGSAMELAQTNIIYAIAAMGFILPAEKILRNIFGFNKAGAGTVGALTGFTAGTLANKFMKGKGGGSGKPSGGNSTPEGEKPPRFEKKHDVNEIEGGDIDNSPSDSNYSYNQNQPQENENINNDFTGRTLESGQTNSGIVLPESYNQRQAQERARNQRQEKESQEPQNKNNKFRNWANYHNINGRGLMKGAGKAIKGVAKFGTRTAFKAGTGALAAAVTAAAGGGLGGVSAAFMAGSTVGGKLGDKVVNAGSHIAHGAGRVGKFMAADDIKEADEALWAGTSVGKELDIANGNTRYQDAAKMKEFKNDKNNVQYVKEYLAAQNGGVPSAKEVKQTINNLDPYMAEGLNDIKDMLKAQKAEQYGISSKQAAIIAAIGKEKGITQDILNDDKKVKAQQANLKQEFVNKGQSEASASKQADYTINVLKAQNGVAHNLKKPKK